MRHPRARGARKQPARSAPLRPGFEEDGREAAGRARRPTCRSRTTWAVRTAYRSGKAAIVGAPACTDCRTHIAISGQSLAVHAFWSGQHGMSPDIDISVISAAWPCAAAAGAASGAMAKPAVTKTAITRLISRRRFIPLYPTGPGTLKGCRFHMFASGPMVPPHILNDPA